MVLPTSIKRRGDVPALPGQLAYPRANAGHIESLVNGTEAKQTIGTLTAVHNPSVGDYTITITLESSTGEGVTTETFVYSADDGTADDATTIAAGLVALINANQNANDVLVASNADGVITLTVRYPNHNPVSAVTGTATGTDNTLTASPTVTNYAANAIIPFGYMVGRYTGTPVGACTKITTASGLTQLGVAIYSRQIESEFPQSTSDVTGYGDKANVEIATNTVVWVEVAAAVVAYTQPGFVSTTGQFTTNGVGTAATGCQYLDSVAAGGLARVSINIP